MRSETAQYANRGGGTLRHNGGMSHLIIGRTKWGTSSAILRGVSSPVGEIIKSQSKARKAAAARRSTVPYP